MENRRVFSQETCADRGVFVWQRGGAGVFENRRSGGRGVPRRRRQQLPGGVEPMAAGRTEEAIVTNFGEAFGKDVLKKAVNKLGGGKRDVADLLSLVVTVSK